MMRIALRRGFCFARVKFESDGKGGTEALGRGYFSFLDSRY